MTDDLVKRLHKIADASRREDGSDIPLGEHLREAADAIERLTRERDEAREQLDASQANCDAWYEATRNLNATLVKLEADNARLREALSFYADPEIYKGHPHGIAFDRSDKSYVARAALEDR